MAMVFENLDQKTFVADNPEQIDALVNNFKKKNIIRFTQANFCFNPVSNKFMYMSTVFYLPTESTEKEPVIEKPSLSQLPKVVVPESQAQWTNCLICNMRWKFTHYRLCPQRHGIEALPPEFKERYFEIWNGDGNGDKKTDTSN